LREHKNKNEVNEKAQITESHYLEHRRNAGYLQLGEHSTWISQNEARLLRNTGHTKATVVRRKSRLRY
jgi:hypothetical protein